MKRKAILAALLLCCVCAVSQAAPARWWPAWEQSTTQKPEHVVQAIQYLLRARGYNVAADGIYGKKTANAVRDFQRRRKIVRSGKMNNATWEALVVTIKPGSRGNAVRAAQMMLRHADYDIPLDGVFGRATKDAVVKFQRVRGKTRDGIIGLNTWCELVEGTVGEPQGD